MKPAIVRCLRCGYKLTNPVSVKREIGPVCWRRLKSIQKLDHWNQDSGEEYHEREELCHLTGDACTGDPMFCEECPVMVPEMEPEERTDCLEYVVCKMEAHGNGHGLGCTDCQVYTPEEAEPTLPTCPSCGKASPNPHYCIQCGSPMKAKALEVVA